ncbi:MAG: ATP-dependent Clp protease ATP-binding subunit, partial [Patescibacteria group bacterium]
MLNIFGTKKTEPVVPVVPEVVNPQPLNTDITLDPAKRHDVSVLSHLDARTSAVFTHAKEEALRVKQQFIEPEHLLLGMMFDSQLFGVLEEAGLNAGNVSAEIQAKEVLGVFGEQPTLSEASKQIIEKAYIVAKKSGSEFVSPEHVFTQLLVIAQIASFLKSQGLDENVFSQKLQKAVGTSATNNSILAKFGIDLTQSARDGKLDPIAGRDEEIKRLTHILLRRTKNNPIIIGEAGTGKTAIVEGFAQDIATGKAPAELSQRRIIQLDLSSLVAGASHRGEFEERLRNVIKEAQESNGTIILFIDEIHTLIGEGDTQGALDASNIIKPFLARGQLQIIGTTTTAEYRKYFEKDKAFARRFQPILCDEPSEEAAVSMISILKPKYEKYHSVTIPDEILKDAVHLSKKYIGERYLPDKAVDLIDEAGAEVKLQHAQGKRQDTILTKQDIQNVVSAWTGIPISKLTEDESQKLLELEKRVHQRLVGQDEAVKMVAEAVRRGRIGLSSPNRPIASFIFLGPTGTGKTELAKTLAEILFGRDDALIRLDMSEYMEKHEVAKLIGAPPGYVGYEEGGQLTEAVRTKPYSIVLLDEVEKAHPDVFNILLQLLEDGRLTDNKGNTVSFKNTIVIATSNIGSILIQQQLATVGQQDAEKTFAQLRKVLTQELTKFFRPELLNRFDGVVIFKPLLLSEMNFIAKLSIDKTRNLLKEQKINVEITEPALAELAREGYDPMYGARPLRRLIQTAIENPIAVELISKKFVSGDVIQIDYDKIGWQLIDNGDGPESEFYIYDTMFNDGFKFTHEDNLVWEECLKEDDDFEDDFIKEGVYLNYVKLKRENKLNRI